ncbi:MAG: 1-deoxy-D-xylulose-5-phosphate synthase, partial [Clostridiales bacterium]|nr:1-deoxy-D-xylulose-5-phosphate synthase [Clostridiales bacterium]
MGVYNGNNLEELLPVLNKAKEKLNERSVLLHVVTKKGQGYPFCENAPAETHGVSPCGAPQHEYSAAMGEELSALAAKDNRIVAVTAAMTDSLGLRNFFSRYPDRAFDVGICEEHASVLCASMAAEGLKPYYAIYSTFLQRAFDEIIHDVCGQNLPVTFCIDRAGITGADGETHQGVFDLSYLSLIPNLAIAIPKNIGEFRAMLRMSANYNAPLAIRYPREGTEDAVNTVEIGKFEILHSSMSNIVLLAAGERCLRLAKCVQNEAQKEGIDFSIINARFLKPLDEELLSGLQAKYIITLEDNVVTGGLGEAIDRFYLNSGKVLRNFGLKEAFIPHGSVSSLSERFGLSKKDILD